MSRACAVVGVGVAVALAVAAALGAGAVGVALSGCRTIAPAPDVVERDALKVKLGPDPEAEAREWEARGELEQALRWRRAIALARPADAGARRELVRAGLLVGRGDEKAGAVRRAMGLDAVDYVWLAADKAAASEEVARLCLAAGVPRLGVEWGRRAVGYGGGRGDGEVVRRRMLLLGRLALEIGDAVGAREVLVRLKGASTSASPSSSPSSSPSPDVIALLGEVARGASIAAAALARELLTELATGGDAALAAEAQHTLELLVAP